MNNLKIRNNLFIIFYFIGLLHWLFFYFFVDYYSYYKIDPTTNINTPYIGSHFQDQNHLSVLKNSFYKNDKDLIRSIVQEKKIKFSQIFQYKEYDAHDWSKDHKYQNIIAQSLREFKIPYKVKNLTKLFPLPKDNFFGLPTLTKSPQIILLYFFDSEIFTIINLILLYSIGFVGCLLIRNYYNLSVIPFVFLFLIFNFNGYWIEKYSAYGGAYLGYYLLPYIFYFLLRLSDAKNNQSRYFWSILVGLFLTLLLMQGTFHLYVELLTFFVFWSIVNYKFWKASFLIFFTNFITGLYILLPITVTFGLARNPHPLKNKVGYTNIETFISGLVSTQDQLTPHLFTSWERSLYISIIGLFLLVYFSLWTHVIQSPWRKFTGWKYFLIPSLLITIISFYKFKFYIVPDFIPLLNAESLYSRYMIIPLIFLTIIATINFQGFVEHYRKVKRVNLVLIGAIGTMALFLFNHSRLWRNHLVQNQYDWSLNVYPNSDASMGVFEAQKVDLFIYNSNVDLLYIISIWFGLIITLISLIFFTTILLKLHNNKES